MEDFELVAIALNNDLLLRQLQVMQAQTVVVPALMPQLDPGELESQFATCKWVECITEFGGHGGS